jgi:broad specificity phosphatase PhoE
MAVRIHLIRHGRSAHVHSGWIDSQGFRAWREAYELAGIVENESPPQPLVQLAAGAGVVVSSDTPRARQSASLLAPGREVASSPLLCELDLLGPPLGPLHLPLPLWALAVGLRCSMLRVLGKYPSEAERSRVLAAAEWLAELARLHGSVIAVTHASFRRQLAHRLLAQGWEREGNEKSLRHWSAWSFGASPEASGGALDRETG